MRGGTRGVGAGVRGFVGSELVLGHATQRVVAGDGLAGLEPMLGGNLRGTRAECGDEARVVGIVDIHRHRAESLRFLDHRGDDVNLRAGG